MDWSLFIVSLLKIVEVLRDSGVIKFTPEQEALISRELKETKTVEEVHALVEKLRGKVTK